MLHLRKAICIFLMALLLAQPVFATEAVTTPSEPVEPDIVTAVRNMEHIPAELSPLAASTDELQFIRQLTTAPLYAMQENGSWKPVLARALPEDVTADYAGTYGIPTDAARGYAFRILLNGDACWDDGVFITAEDYLYTIGKLLLCDETAANWLFLANAAAIRDGKNKNDSGIVSLQEAGFSGIAQAWNAGHTEFFVDTDGFWGLDGGWKSVSDRNRLRDFAMPGGLDECFVTPAYLYHNYLMDGTEHSRFQSEFIGIHESTGNPLSMDDLGLIQVNKYELVLILQSPCTVSTLMQNLEALSLLRADRRGNSMETYGPYRVTSATSAEIILEPNPNWWGAADPRGYDRIICQKIDT